ncbi:hypothetical protein BLNAU_10930 [Blattamonas nauphoetae]|uniref:Membrane-associated protein n=1 Tax=Blattamonas nauphoetae TaxID=2049346 RepID=A0ABQ9XNZ5_9EUKA|nr:hypothetical protein BLNAU_10930 [Blattamonas nauphoetae]
MLIIPLLITCLISGNSPPDVLPSLTDSIFSASNANTIDGRVVRFLPLKAYESNTLLLHSMTVSIHGLYETPSRIVEGGSARISLIDVVNSTTTLSRLCFHPTEIRSVRVGISSFVEIIESEVWIPSADSPLECNSGFLQVEHSSFALMNPKQTIPSLATSMSSESSVVFSSCSFSDLGVSDDGPLFCSTNVSNVTLLNLKMSNISTTHSSLAHHISNRAGNVSIVGSSVTDSEDVLTGGLVPGMSLATSFFVANTTISKCFTNAVDTTENNPSMVHETLSASHTFINCTWTSTTTSINGGAIHINNTGDLTIDSCRFLHCKATSSDHSNGGAISFLSEVSSPFAFSLNSSTFDTCYSACYSGSVYVNRSSSFFMKFTNFSTSSVGYTRLTTHLLYLPDGSILSNLRFEYAFSESANSESGAIDFDTILADITHSNILFNSNTAGSGGALLYSFTSGKPNISWFSCIFFNNKAETVRPITDDPGNSCVAGNDLYFWSDTAEWNATLAREGSFRNCFSNSDFPRIVIDTLSQHLTHAIRFPTNNTLLSTLFPTPSLIVSVRDDANDEAGCGMNYFLPCKTLGYTGKNQLTFSTGEVLVEAGLFEETIGFAVNTKSVSITSFGNENPVFDLSSVEETFLTISDGFDANLKYLSFIVAGHAVLQHIGTGKVNMDSCLLTGKENRSPTSSDLISTTGSLTVRNTRFSCLTVGSGALLKWGSSSSVSLTDLFFLNLGTTNSAPFTITSAATLSLSGLYFEKCVGTSFSDFEVDQSVLSQLPAIASSLSTSTSPRTPLKDGEQLTLWPSYQMVVDGNEGVDEAFCWLTSKKCRTLSNLVTRLGSNFEGTIIVSKGRTSEAGIVLVDSQQLTVSGESQTESLLSLESSETSLIIVPSASSLSLSALTLTLPCSHTSSPVISSTGTLALSSVVIALSSSHTDLSADILSVTSGTASLVSCSFDGENNSIGSFMSQTGGTMMLEACSMSRMKMKKSFVSGSGTVLMKGCSFSSLVDDCSSGSGNVIEMGIGEGEKLEIMKSATDSSSFISCSSKGNGGALKIAVVSSGTLTISDTSFVCCSATGNGGGIWLDLSASTSTSTSFSSLVFGSGFDSNNAILGTKVFVKSTNLKTDAEGVLIGLKPTLSGLLLTPVEKNEFVGNNTSPESLLFFWYPHIATSGAVHVHSDGEDHANCGLIELACQTLSHSFTSLKTTRTITLDSALQVPASLPTLTQSLTISTLAGSPQTLTLASDVSFTVSAGTLSFSSLSIELAELSTTVFVVAGGSIVMDSTCRIVNPSSATHSASLFSLSSGTLTLDTTTLDFSNRFISSQSLFSQSGGSLALSGMSIENVTRSSGDGSVISSILSTGSLSIASCSFSSCVCSSGNGGMMKVVLTGTGTFTVTGTTTFSSCSASGDGNLIHLSRSDLVSFLKGSGTGPLDAIRPNTTSGVAFTSEIHEEFWGIDTNAVSPSSGSLLFYWYPHTTGSVHVASSGTDHPNCGLVELPCSSLSHSMNVMKTTKSVVILSDLPLSASLTSLDVTWTLSRSGTEKLTLSGNGGILVDQSTTHFTLSSLEMKCGTMAVDRTIALICVTNGKVLMADCSIGDASGEIPIPFCTISTGTVELTGTNTILNPSVSSPLFTVASGSLLIDGDSTSFTTITSTSTGRSASLFALNGGSSTVNFASLPILGTGTGQDLFAVSRIATLKLNKITLDGGDASVESLLDQNGGTVTLEACSMSRMKMKKSFVCGSGTVLMKGCSFSSLVDDCSSGSGNVIEMGIGEGEKLEIMKTATDSSSFISCSSKGNGGALKIAVVSSGTVTISDTSFVCCSASGNGGGIWLDLSSCTSTSTSFSSLVFGSGPDSNTAILGSKVYVQSSNVKTDAEGVLIGLKPTLSGSLLTAAEKHAFVVNNTSPESLLFFWYPHIASVGVVHVHSLGEDHANCGRIELACQTLSHSFTSLKTTRTITLDSSLQVAASLPTLTQSLTISTLAGSPQTLTLASDVSFTVSAGTLSFSSLSIELAELSTTVFVVAGGSIVMDSTCRLVNPSSATHSASLFSLSSGTLTLDTTTLDFSNRFISSQSLFSQSGGSLSLSGMSIENVTRSSGDGSVISSTLSSGSLSIARCSFSSCICSSGNGGVMKVVLTGTGTFTVTGTTTFSSCSASGDGNLIHLSCPDLVSFLGGVSAAGPLDAIRPNTTSGVAFTSEVYEEFWGIDTKTVSPSSGSLLFYWYPHTTGSVRVASSGTDHPNCGLVELPCSSLSHSMNVMKTTKSVVMMSDIPLSASLTSIGTTWSLSRSGTEKLTLSGNGGIIVDQSTTHVTLLSLVMKCGTMTVDRTSALICVTNGKVSMTDCSVGDASGEIPIPFCTISTGTVELTGTNTILNPSVSSPLFTVASGSLLIDGDSTSFTTITSTSTGRSASLFALNGGSSTVNFASLPILGTGTGQNLFAVSGTATLKLNKITLDGGDASAESLLGQNGGTVTLEACSMSRMKMKKSFVCGSGTVLMKGCSFSSLVDDCSSGSGNVIEMGIGEGEKLEIMKTATDSSSFISCSSKGNGGALKIAVVSSGTVTISDTSFVCCSASGNGGGIWIDASSSVGSISLSLLSLSFGRNNDANSCGMDKGGRDVFVVGGRLIDFISKEKWLGTFETAPEWTLVGLDGSSGEKVDLAAMLRQTVLFVGKDGNDEDGDGTLEAPFLTLHGGMEKGMKSGEDVVWIEIVESARIGKRIVMEGGSRKTCGISGREEGSRIVCSISDGSDRTEGQIIICGHTLSVRGLELNMKVDFGKVFVLQHEGQLGLSECSVSGERGLKSGLVRVGSEGELTLNEVATTDLSLTEKASIVEMAGGRVWMEGSSFSEVTVVGGGVLCGGVSGGMEVRKTSFTGCRGERFGSVVRVRAAGSSVVLSECTFRDCWSGVNFGEVESSVWRVGGGSVFVWMERKKGGRLESVDLSGSEFTNCILENTNTTTVSTGRGRDCVGGSGFVIVGGRGHRVDLSDVSVSDCVCRNVDVGDKRGFSGGVVGWTEKGVQTDRRGMKVRGSEVGMVGMRNE